MQTDPLEAIKPSMELCVCSSRSSEQTDMFGTIPDGAIMGFAQAWNSLHGSAGIVQVQHTEE